MAARTRVVVGHCRRKSGHTERAGTGMREEKKRNGASNFPALTRPLALTLAGESFQTRATETAYTYIESNYLSGVTAEGVEGGGGGSQM
jgi:hypothetical protein